MPIDFSKDYNNFMNKISADKTIVEPTPVVPTTSPASADIITVLQPGEHSQQALEAVADFSEKFQITSPDALFTKFNNERVAMAPPDTTKDWGNAHVTPTAADKEIPGGSNEYRLGLAHSTGIDTVPDSDGNPITSKFTMWFDKFVQSIYSFFGQAKTVTHNVEGEIRAENPGWFHQTVGNTDLTRGAAVAIGVGASLIVVFLYKLVGRFTKKSSNRYENAMALTKNHLYESFLMLNNVSKVMTLQEAVGNSNTIIQNARPMALSMMNFVTAPISPNDGKIVRFLKKIRPFTKVILIACSGVAIGVVGYEYFQHMKDDRDAMQEPYEKVGDQSDMDKFANDGEFGKSNKFKSKGDTFDQMGKITPNADNAFESPQDMQRDINRDRGAFKPRF